MKKINDQQIEWKYVPTHEIPTDIGSRATKQQLQVNETWMNGPGWLSKPEKWSEQLQVTPSEKSEYESRMVKEVMKVNNPKLAGCVNSLLANFQLSKTVRILAWVRRFIDNFVYSKKVNGPLTIKEIQKQMQFFIKRSQSECEAHS